MVKKDGGFLGVRFAACFLGLCGILSGAPFLSGYALGDPPRSENAVAEHQYQQELDLLLRAIAANPTDMDLNYKYAALATRLKRYDEALAAYDRMLMANPNLPRVRLDMALVHMRHGNAALAEREFRHVLAQNPPPQVKKNIEAMLARLETGKKRHRFSGSVSAGWAHDDNPSASPDSGNVSVFDVIVPIDNPNGTRDSNFFASGVLNHAYQFENTRHAHAPHSWESNLSVYKTKQNTLSHLDLQVISLRTGPMFALPNLRSKWGFALVHNDVRLDGEAYMRVTGPQLSWESLLSERVRFTATARREYRKFFNTAEVNSYEARTGHATDLNAALTVLASPNDIFNLGVLWRSEDAKEAFYANRQHGLHVGYTRLLPYGVYASLGVLFKHSDYRAADPLVSPTTTRADHERTYSITVGKMLAKDWMLSASYQAKEINSNLVNYAYENKRFMTNVAYQF